MSFKQIAKQMGNLSESLVTKRETVFLLSDAVLNYYHMKTGGQVPTLYNLYLQRLTAAINTVVPFSAVSKITDVSGMSRTTNIYRTAGEVTASASKSFLKKITDEITKAQRLLKK